MTALREISRLDLDLFEELRDSLAGEPDALPTIYQTFLLNASRFIGALPGQEPAERLKTLHTLKGSAAMVGASRLASMAASLQEQGPRQPSEVAAAVEALQTELNAFRSVIAAQLPAPGSTS